VQQLNFKLLGLSVLELFVSKLCFELLMLLLTARSSIVLNPMLLLDAFFIRTSLKTERCLLLLQFIKEFFFTEKPKAD
jgi:hypothetical protein